MARWGHLSFRHRQTAPRPGHITIYGWSTSGDRIGAAGAGRRTRWRIPRDPIPAVRLGAVHVLWPVRHRPACGRLTSPPASGGAPWV